MIFIIFVIISINILYNSKNLDSIILLSGNPIKNNETSEISKLHFLIYYSHLNKKLIIKRIHVVIKINKNKLRNQNINIKKILEKNIKLRSNNIKTMDMSSICKKNFKYILINLTDHVFNIPKKYFMSDKNVNLIKEKDKIILKKLIS